MRLLASARSMLRSLGVTKPIWNTEINYGLQTGGGGVARDIPQEGGVPGRPHLHRSMPRTTSSACTGTRWDLQKLANTQLTEADGRPDQGGVGPTASCRAG